MRRRVVLFLGLLCTPLCWLWIGAAPGDPALYPPKAGEPAIDVFVVDHGYHAGLIVPVNDLQAVAARDNQTGASGVVERFVGYHYVEMGWGDEGFYRHVPTIGALTWRLGYAALTNRSPTAVLHLVGFDVPPAEEFPRSTVLHLRLSSLGFARLVARYNETIPVSAQDQPEDLGPGLYGDSEFYRAAGVYNAFNDCNQWVAGLLAAAGVPASHDTSSTSFGLMTELRWRAGAEASAIP